MPRQPPESEASTLRRRVYLLFEEPSRPASRRLNQAILLLIVANVAAIMLESMESVAADYRRQLFWFDVFSVAVFSVEYLLRLWAAPENPRFRSAARPRLRYALTPMAVVDFLAVAPFFLSWITPIDTRMLRALRLVRLFKLTRYSASMELLMTVVRKEAASFASALFVMLLIIVLSASGIYVVERDSQPDSFGSIPAAMWWATVTLTTVGYGDVVPTTLLGRIFGMLITIAGVGMAALPAGIVASGFSRELEIRRQQLKSSVAEAMADGEITGRERRELEAGAEELGLRDEELEGAVAREAAKTTVESQIAATVTVCPQCGHRIGSS